MDDRVYLPDVGKKTVPQTLALGSAGHEARDIHKLNGSGDDFCRINELRDRLKTYIRDLNDANVRVDRTERIVLGLRPCVG